MAEDPWLTIVGLGEDGPAGLSPASRTALEGAEIVFGPPRHLSLLPELTAEMREWPVPFSDGLPLLDGFKGRRVVVLASGDPFWFGAGSTLARRYGSHALRVLPAPSTFSLAAARLGWPLETTLCLGLHAAPLSRLRPHLAPGQRVLCLMRDGAAVQELGQYLAATGFGETRVTVLEALGGARERNTATTVTELGTHSFQHPVAVALEIAGDGEVLPHTPGLPDALYEHDGQITKRHIRTLTLSTLAPRFGEHLWDIGGGAGSVAIEWCLAHPSTTATVIEADVTRAARIRRNADRLGVDRLVVQHAQAPEGLSDLSPPAAVFIGGGLSEAVLNEVTERVPPGTRLVANAVTLDSETLLVAWQSERGGALTRIALSSAEPLGARLGWKAAYPVVQWSVVL
ncbi:MAG: precorrin-6y C5,15-methyltransferase (decarboxylating) subunit CbiE [Pseudomonadota bacterium]